MESDPIATLNIEPESRKNKGASVHNSKNGLSQHFCFMRSGHIIWEMIFTAMHSSKLTITNPLRFAKIWDTAKTRGSYQQIKLNCPQTLMPLNCGFPINHQHAVGGNFLNWGK